MYLIHPSFGIHFRALSRFQERGRLCPETFYFTPKRVTFQVGLRKCGILHFLTENPVTHGFEQYDQFFMTSTAFKQWRLPRPQHHLIESIERTTRSQPVYKNTFDTRRVNNK
ncbi:hypothetical protein RISW2_20625 [Roseivivax isoporae LMG 25204]|uniref:Uncharacterized protein n=1 Tax=Roseivivax isoporae LMG 25204 TaxID=1449351 RepID=X7F3R9_9RHOB|nr:hypothetical protein RISW2_20625 [Roseivivax isoporae LMG 25204]